MKRFWPVLLLLGAGCGKWEAEHWKQKFLSEVNYHYQTQQIKNAEIAARELEIENQKSHIRILEDRIHALERKEPDDAPRKLEAAIEARVTAVDLVMIAAGREHGVFQGMEFRITHEGQTLAKAVVECVDAKESVAKLKEKKRDPKEGDAAVRP